MKNIFKILAVAVLALTVSTETVWAGNDARRGTAGAAELLINPWARSAGWGSVNVANARGLESFYSNIAGLTYVGKTEIAYSNSMYLGGKSGLSSGANINAFGLAQRISEQGVLGVYVMSMSFGDINVTTYDSPEAGFNGTFSPTFMNINVAYAHSFSQSIHGGAVVKIITESTDNVSASGFAIDAGIQYVTGAEDELKFGLALKNWGTTMSFDGSGLSLTMVNHAGNNFTVESRSAEMELPTSMLMGFSYDFLFEKWNQRLTFAGSFTSNAFLKDNFTFGIEYSLLDMLQLRGGYVFQKNIFSAFDEGRTTSNAGLCAGASFEIPLAKKDKNSNTAISLDYAYRAAFPLKGTHSVGATIKL